jgi:hypothetical protein
MKAISGSPPVWKICLSPLLKWYKSPSYLPVKSVRETGIGTALASTPAENISQGDVHWNKI